MTNKIIFSSYNNKYISFIISNVCIFVLNIFNKSIIFSWLTTENHFQFPIQILQLSIKFTNEPPQGIRAGLKRTYGFITQDKLDYIETIHWRPLLYAISFLHSIVQVRTFVIIKKQKFSFH